MNIGIKEISINAMRVDDFDDSGNVVSIFIMRYDLFGP